MLSSFCQEESGILSFSREQGSRFAKTLADDFNPLHDTDAKRFCVPGDLLFSIVLKKYGISKKMSFSFLGMVTEKTRLVLPEASEELIITDGVKSYLSVKRSGEVTQSQSLIENLIKSYVAFSGTTFPHVIVPLMAEQDAMINPARPMVMYQSMSIDLDRLDLTAPKLVFAQPKFEHEGKRGNITLPFDLIENDEVVGRGEKHMVVSGIKPYDETAIAELVAEYNSRKL